jgi:hypothetical protein
MRLWELIRSSKYNGIINTGFIYLSVALQPFAGPWPLFFSLSLSTHRRQDSLDGGLTRRKAATYTQNNTNTE